MFPLRDDAFSKIKNIAGLLEVSRLVRFLDSDSNFGRPVIQRGKSDPAYVIGAKKRKRRGFEQSEPALKHPSDERARGNRRVAGSEPSLALRQLAEEAWARVKVIVRRG